MWTLLRHPVRSAQGIGSAACNYDRTFEAVKGDYAAKLDTPRGQASIVGDFLIGLLTGGALKAGDKAVSAAKLSRKLEHGIDAAEEAADAARKAAAKADDAGEACRKSEKDGPGCFAAGTPIRTPWGCTAVEHLRAGDLVLARDQHDPEAPVKAVPVEKALATDNWVVTLRVNGREVVGTPGHPVYALGKGWTELGRLERGDRIAGLDEFETPAVVEAVDHTRELRAVYNIRIPEAHTYFVGSLEWGFSLWAHNPDLDCDGRDDVTGEPVEGNADEAAERAASANAVNKANADPRKFNDYIFKEGATHGKDKVFRGLGYGKEHSDELREIWQKQAAEKYARGDYALGKADQYGQRIEIELPGIGDAAGKKSHLRSGWMIQPDGSIKLNTPFSGFTR